MTPSTVTTLAQRELSDALRNRWFVAYSFAFVALSVALAMLVINSAGYGGVSGFHNRGERRCFDNAERVVRPLALSAEDRSPHLWMNIVQ